VCVVVLQVVWLWDHSWRLCCSDFSSEIKLTPQRTESVWEYNRR